MSSVKRKALIVLGMHRSGTSALGGVLARLGAALPKTLMPPTPDNPRGYMESVRFMKFHDEILASSGSSWNDWGKFNPDWFESDVADEFHEQLPRLLEEEFGNSRLFVLKDPRICRFFPFWVRACQDLDIAVKVVIPVRNPLEVAQSLHTRDQFGPSRGLLIWLRHVLDAEHASREVDRCLLRYSDLLGDWRAEVSRLSSQLRLRWPRRSSKVEVEIDSFLESELRRQASNSDRLEHGGELMSWVKTAYGALNMMIDDPTRNGEAQEILDGIRAKFDRTAEAYGAAVHEELATAESRTEESERRLQEALAEAERLARCADEAESRIKERERQLQEISAEAERLAKRADKAEEQLAAMTEETKQLRDRIGSLDAQAANARKLQEHWKREANELTQRLQAAEQSDAQRLQQISGQSSQIEELKARIDRLQPQAERLVQVEERLRLREDAFAGLQEELGGAQAQARRLEADTGKLTARIRALESENLRYQEQKRVSSEELAILSRRMLADHARQEKSHAEAIARLSSGHARAEAALRAEIEELNAANAEAVARLSSEHAQAEAALRTEIDELNAANAQLARQVEDLLQSTSWRMTAPARLLSSAAKSLLGRGKSDIRLLGRDH